MLQRKLASYATSIGKFGLAAAVLVFVAESARFRCGMGLGWGAAGQPAGVCSGGGYDERF